MIRAKLNVQDQDGYTALLVACYLNYERIIDGINVAKLWHFVFAILTLDYHVSAVLLGAGAMPNIAASDGMTPLMAAVESNNFKVVGWLIERGGASANSKTSNGATALHAAARLGYRKICDLLGM